MLDANATLNARQAWRLIEETLVVEPGSKFPIEKARKNIEDTAAAFKRAGLETELTESNGFPLLKVFYDGAIILTKRVKGIEPVEENQVDQNWNPID